MDTKNIALRAQDFHEGLKETKSFGPKEAYFSNTLLIGKAATLAMHLKGLLYVNDYTGLMYAAAELGISALELPQVLRNLEEVDFVRVVRSGSKTDRVDIRVPEFRDGYEDLGELWKTLNPTDAEAAGIHTLDSLFALPIDENALSNLGLSGTELAIMQDVMKSGQLMRAQTVSGNRLFYTPLAVDANPGSYLRWTQQYGDQVGELLKLLTENQGLPLSSTVVLENGVVNDAILSGVLMPVSVEGVTGEQRFLFAPRGGLSAEERVIMDKARAILACVRYGENFAAGRRILYPRAILQQLLDQKRFRQGHPDLRSQYGLLVRKQIGRPIDEGNGRWNFEIIDTPENTRALRIAIDMLEIGESPSARMNVKAHAALLNPQSYLSPGSTRTRLATSISSSEETEADILRKITSLARGNVEF